MNVANLNPLKCIGGISRGFSALSKQYNRGIWIRIRKNILGNILISLTFRAGSNLYHWCVMINGTICISFMIKAIKIFVNSILQIQFLKKTFSIFCNRFENYLYKENDIEFVNHIQDQNVQYSLLSLFDIKNKTLNCQTFVIILLIAICGNKNNIVLQLLLGADGTLLGLPCEIEIEKYKKVEIEIENSILGIYGMIVAVIIVQKSKIFFILSPILDIQLIKPTLIWLQDYAAGSVHYQQDWQSELWETQVYVQMPNRIKFLLV